MKRFLAVAGVAIYAFVIVLSSAGALNYGFTNGETIYTIGGFLNLATGGYIAYKYITDFVNNKLSKTK